MTGAIASNGGAGASSGGDPNGDDLPPEANGIDGQDGLAGTTAAAPGTAVGTWSAPGGAGAATNVAEDGVANNDCDGNGGGGGGSVGRIVIALPSGGSKSVTGTASPVVFDVTY